MQTISAQDFKKKYGESAVSAFNEPKPDPGIFEQIKQSFQGGINKIGEGLQEAKPAGGGGVQGLVTGEGKILGGAAEAATSFLAPALNATIGKGVDFAANKISDNPSVQKFAESPTGQKTAKVAETVGNYAEAAGLVAGGVESPKVPGKVGATVSRAAESLPKPPDLGGAATYLKSAVKDVSGTMQNRIDHQIAVALELTPGDLTKIKDSTGNEVGKWLSDNNLIGTNKATTQAAIDDFKAQNYNLVRSEIAKVGQSYIADSVPRYVDALKAIKTITQDVLGLEKENAEIDGLLRKKTVTLEDVQHVKELMDDHFNLYKITGDVGQGVAKEGLANVRADIKNFIEKEVQKNTGADIRQLNNNVSTARSLSDAISTRSSRGLTRSMLSQRDIMTGMGLTYFGSPILGAAFIILKKIGTSPTIRLRVARYLDQLSDKERAKISADLNGGKVPTSIQKIAGE